jgi:hypothetical protein
MTYHSDTKSTDVVMLKNGAEVPRSLVAATMLALESLLRDNPMAFYELVELCRDATHQIWGDLDKELASRGLITLRQLSTGKTVALVHETIRNIIVSAVEGEGCEMALGVPV